MLKKLMQRRLQGILLVMFRKKIPAIVKRVTAIRYLELEKRHKEKGRKGSREETGKRTRLHIGTSVFLHCEPIKYTEMFFVIFSTKPCRF